MSKSATKTKSKKDSLVYSVKQVADLLCRSKNTIYLAIENKEIPAVKIGRTYMIPKSVIDNFSSNIDGIGKSF